VSHQFVATGTIGTADAATLATAIQNAAGYSRLPMVVAAGTDEIELTFKNTGDVPVEYRLVTAAGAHVALGTVDTAGTATTAEVQKIATTGIAINTAYELHVSEFRDPLGGGNRGPAAAFSFSFMTAMPEAATMVMPTASAYSALSTLSFFRTQCPKACGVTLEYTCLDYSHCPVFQHCVVSEERMAAEVQFLRQSRVSRAGRVADISQESRLGLLMGSNWYPRVVASDMRVEAVIDTVQYVEASGHFLHHELARDQAHALYHPRVRIEAVGINTAKALIVVAAPGAAGIELGTPRPSPAGFSPWLSDIIRVERFDASAACLEDSAEVQVWAPSAVGTVPRVFVNGAALPVVSAEATQVVFEGATVAATGTEGNHEQGWWTVSFTSLPCSADFALAADVDECALGTHDCDENADCTNQVADNGEPGYTCECRAGYTGDGHAGDSMSIGAGCLQTGYTEETWELVVENLAEVTYGWRVQDVLMYADGQCMEPLNGADETGGYAWVELERSACRDSAEVDAALTADHPDRCSALCAADPTHPLCATYDGTSSELCLPSGPCRTVCASVATCSYITMADGRCQLYTEDCGPSTQGGATTWGKDRELIQHLASASMSFASHLPGMAVDGSNGTAWWTGVRPVPVRGAQLKVGLNPAAENFEITGGVWRLVRGVQVVQAGEQHMSASTSVSVGPQLAGARVAALDHPATHIQHTLSGSLVDSRPLYTGSFHAAGAACTSVECGTRGVAFFGTPIGEPRQNVPSPCHCKQLCLESVDEGCRSWRVHEFSDVNFSPANAAHTHVTCVLMSTPYSEAGLQMSAHAVSGHVDIVVHGLSTTEVHADTTFDLSVVGAVMPSQSARHINQQRLKLVHHSGTCADALPATLSGIQCSADTICHPGPATGNAGSATWSGMHVLSTGTVQMLKACYCAGPCVEAHHWVELPQTLTVLPGSHTHTFSTVATAAITRDTSFNLVVSRPAFADPSPPQYWKVKLVPATGVCTDAASAGLTLDDAATTTTDTATWGVAVAADADMERYLVCFCSTESVEETHEGTDVAPWTSSETVAGVAAAEGWTGCVFRPLTDGTQQYITVTPREADVAVPQGFFLHRSFTARVDADVGLVATGSRLADLRERSKLRVVDGDCAPHPTAVAGFSFQSKADLSDEGKITYALRVADTVAAKRYTLCVCPVLSTEGATALCETEANPSAAYSSTLGTLTVSAQISAPRDWYFTPGEAQSLEIQGTALSLTSDRVMVIPCSGSCGVAAPAPALAAPAHDGTAAVFNDFFPENGVVDQLPALPPVDAQFSTTRDTFCSGNLPAADLPAETAAHLCSAKCAGGCTGPTCFCDGYFAGFESDTALCLPRSECQLACDQLVGCGSFDMHQDLPRCHLNAAGPCEETVMDTSYDLVIKAAPTTRRLNQVATTGDLLRFSPIRFSSSGTFKVCFCDSTLGACQNIADYSAEVGEVHVTGVSCALQHPRLTNTHCYQQVNGGLSCWGGSAPVFNPA